MSGTGMAQVLEFLKDTTISAVTRIFLYLSMSIYNLITMMYAIFKTIAEARFVTADTIKDLTARLYLLVGIIALFLVAYSFLMVIVNPENINKGKFATTKMVRNIILSVITITFVPTIFNFSYAVQKSILDKDVIAKIILDRGSGNIDTGEDYLGDFSISIFESTFYLRDMSETADPDAMAQYDSCAAQSKLYGNIMFFSACSDLIADGQAEFNPILSIIVGLFAVYVLGLYCMDMGLRAVKLVLLQIIAPLPCLLMIIPDQEKVFKTWVKNVVKTFVEVFLKIFILTLGVYMIQLVSNIMHNYGTAAFGPLYSVVGIWVNLFIILGILMFINQAPKLISEIFGIDLGHGLSLKKRLDDVKAGWQTATAPIRAAAGGLNKAIGAGMGVYFANKARKKAEEGEGHPGTTRTKKALSNIMGFRNGWRGGISGSGSAYSYEQLMQQSYALDSTKPEKEQLKGAIFDRARGLIGRDSRYEEEIMDSAITRDRKNALLKLQKQQIDNASGQKIREINRAHEDTLEANKALGDAGASIKDVVDKRVGDVDSRIRLSMDEIYDDHKHDLEAKLASATDPIEKSRIQAEIDSLERARATTNFIANNVDTYERDEDGNVRRGAYGEPVVKKATGEFITDTFNKAGMEAKITEIQKMSDSEMSQDTKNALISMLKHGQDMARQVYVQDVDNWDEDFKEAISAARSAASDKDAGKYRDSAGNVQVGHDFTADFASMDTSTEQAHYTALRAAVSVFDEQIKAIKADTTLTVDEKNLQIAQIREAKRNSVEQQELDKINMVLKIGKEAKKIVSTETTIKNTQMATEEVTFDYTGDNGVTTSISKKLSECSSESSSKDRAIKDNDLAHEKVVESHSSDKAVAEAKQKARDKAPKKQKPSGH